MENYSQIEFLEIPETAEYKELIEKVVETCFNEENLTKTKLYLNVILTNPETIRTTNKKYRNIDKETDVLSFPIISAEDDEQIEDVLGDIMISIPRVIEQAEEYGHSVQRELAYMVVHGFYHVMGYDHMNEQEKSVMRQKEEKILSKLNITRQ